MIFELTQRFYFEAAHTLLRDANGVGRAAFDGSSRVHGHTYHAEVAVRGSPDASSGMLTDLAGLRHEIESLRRLLDHRLLDEVPGLGPATLENLCAFIWKHLEQTVAGLSKVAVERQASGDRCTLRKDC